MISSRLGHSLDPYILSLYRVLFRARAINPNILTVLSVLFALAVFACVATGHFLASGILLIFSGLLDVMDGAVARSFNAVTRFGGFLDSVLDRYTDLLVMFGVLVYFLREGDQSGLFYAAVTFFAAIGTAIIPYARARAEAASLSCNNGILERPERIILLVIAFLFHLVRPVMLILAVVTHVTVIQRILFVKRADAQTSPPPAPRG